MKKRYRFDLSSIQYFLLIFSFLLIGGLLFSLGLMTGYYQSRSSYEQIMMQAAAESQEENKVTIFEVVDEKPRSQKSTITQSKRQSAKVYCVQVASFKKKKDADSLRDSLRKKKYKTFVDQADLGAKGIWYRVQVGRFSEKKKAENFANILMKKEKLKGIVLKK